MLIIRKIFAQKAHARTRRRSLFRGSFTALSGTVAEKELLAAKKGELDLLLERGESYYRVCFYAINNIVLPEIILHYFWHNYYIFFVHVKIIVVFSLGANNNINNNKA